MWESVGSCGNPAEITLTVPVSDLIRISCSRPSILPYLRLMHSQDGSAFSAKFQLLSCTCTENEMKSYCYCYCKKLEVCSGLNPLTIQLM